MAITLFPETTEQMTPVEFLDHVARHVDPYSDESIMSASHALAKLARNRSFLVDFVNSYLLAEAGGPRSGFYSMQSALLGQTDDGVFKLRANFWAPVRTSGRAARDEAALLSYELAHDHNFPFLTIGYFGPGYDTLIYEYDKSTVAGYEGERVELRFLEKARLEVNKVLFFRPSTDIHIQLPPKSFSISLNLLVHRKDNPLIPQYVFDVERGNIAGFVDSIDNLRIKVLQLAGHVFDADTPDLLREIAKTHRCVRTRHMALRSLALASPEAKEQVMAMARDLPEHLRAELRT